MDCTPPGSSVPGISQAEYWSGLPCPPPGDLPNPEIEPRSLKLQADSLPTSLVAQRLKRLPGMQETLVQSQSWEDPLEKEMATHSSTLAWRIPWREEPGRLQSMGLQGVGHD